MSFRAKLLQSILGIVAASIFLTLFFAQSQNTALHQKLADDYSRYQLSAFREEQQKQITEAAGQARRFADSVRLFAALEEMDPQVYRIALDEKPMENAAFFRLAGVDGPIIAPPDDAPGVGLFSQEIERELIKQLSLALPSESSDMGESMVGLVVLPLSAPTAQGKSRFIPYHVIARPIINFDKYVGMLLVGMPVESIDRMQGHDADSSLQSGLWVNGSLVSGGISESVALALSDTLRNGGVGQDNVSRDWIMPPEGPLYRIDVNLLNPESPFPAAYLVTLFSLEQFREARRKLNWQISLIGLVSLIAASVTGFVFARYLSEPIQRLVQATQEVRKGNYEVTVPPASTSEMSALAQSFNEMTAGLALKDRYHSVLQMVADEQVAQELLQGTLQLGGDLRMVSVIFCDIRGYTTLSQHMNPAEVITLLNEHMGILTKVVRNHKGVVSQFAGDAIMILFGAPRSSGDDARNAVLCAWEMMRERDARNASVDSTQPIRIGIGVATGEVLAGCIGAEHRLEYTVVGERVNLAARLCSTAGAGEILIDQNTRDRLSPEFVLETTPPLVLKGFATPVPAYRLLDFSPTTV